MAPPSVLYVYDGKDAGNPNDYFLANGESFKGAVSGRVGDLLDMGGCTDMKALVAIIAAKVKARGMPYTTIVFLDHGNKQYGQTFGNYSLQTLAEKPWTLEATLKQLGQCVSGTIEFWGCNSAHSPTTAIFADLTGKPIKANWNQSVSLTWGMYWGGGPYRWVYPPNYMPPR